MVLQARVEVLQARHLPKMDLAGTCDAFATVQMGYQVQHPHTPPKSCADLSCRAGDSSPCTSPLCIGSVIWPTYIPIHLF